MEKQTYKSVEEYYGKVLKTKEDLKTSACCSLSTVTEYIKEPLSKIEDEIIARFYGCGAPIPYVLEELKILDLGSGTGRDCYIMSYYVGEKGEVVGVDMTQEQLDVANKYKQKQMEKFGFKKLNVRFVKGYIEKLDELELEDNYFDLVISNCVINLSPDKEKVLKEVYRVLKPGGEFYFSDVYSDRRLPDWAMKDDILLGECLGGALYFNDFRRLSQKVGFNDPRILTKTSIDLKDKYVIDKIGFVNFDSITYRLFKIPELEDMCEDYGQVLTYLGTIKQLPHTYQLDNHHIFETGKPERVCSNTAMMIEKTRLKKHFKVQGDLTTHFGLFDCSQESQNKSDEGSCC